MTSPAMATGSTVAIEATDLEFRYQNQVAMRIAECRLGARESMAVIGPSGCGKTTFLHVLAGLLRPTSGTVQVLGQDLSHLQGSRLDRFRGQHIGLVFQRFHLLPALSVRQNVLFAQRLARSRVSAARLQELFERLNLTGLEHHRPSMLSHGQAQRVAIARALVHGPDLVMADEPTSALDDEHAAGALDLLQDVARSAGAALVVVTHDQRIRGRLDHEFEMAAPS